MTEEIFKESISNSGHLIKSYLCDIEVQGNGNSNDEFDHYNLEFAFESDTTDWK
jgi:hypothetical protein